MPIEKISNAFVRTVENHEVSILRDGENVVLRLQSGEQLTFTPGDLREIVDEFAKAPRKPRGRTSALLSRRTARPLGPASRPDA